MNQGFSREKRLLNSSQFKVVFDSPDIRLSGRSVLLLAYFNQLEHPRLGLVIGKKSVKLAVERNRIKRRIRECFRIQQNLLPSVDVVMVARKGLAELSNKELHADLAKIYQRLQKKALAKQQELDSHSR